MTECNLNLTPDAIIEQFHKVDASHDGSIDFMDFETHFFSHFGQLKRREALGIVQLIYNYDFD